MAFSNVVALALWTVRKHWNFIYRHNSHCSLSCKKNIQNKVFAGIAKLSKSTYGWFFGFKLHMVINENGEIHSLTLTKGNVDDRIPVPNLTEKLTGLLFGDKGYIAKELFQKLFDRGLKLVTKVKKGMKNALISLNEKILLRKRLSLRLFLVT